MSAPSALLLYTDDAVEVRYRDGARLCLSPCGTEFMYERPHAGGHPVQKPERGRHRTEYVTSSCREQVLQALIFRNTHSSSPFLPASLIPSEEIMVCIRAASSQPECLQLLQNYNSQHARTAEGCPGMLGVVVLQQLEAPWLRNTIRTLLTDISEVTWPALEDDTGCVTRLEDGSVKVSSLDGHAHLYMTTLQKEVTVKYLCQLSCVPSAPGTTTHNKANAETETKTTRSMNRTVYSSCVLQEASPSCVTKHAFQYTWLVQRFSVADCPQPFQYPMGLALHFHRESVRQSEIQQSVETEEKMTDSYFLERTVSVLPRALPLTCSATHMHRLGFCKFSLEEESLLAVNPLPLKVVIYTDVLYRIILDGTNLVEIHPGDGSVFISEGECMGKYFKHYFMKDTKQVEDRLYSARDLPPDKPRALYSVRSIISQAKRFLECCCKHKLSINPLAHTCCWKMGSGPDSRAVAPVLLEQSFIPNQGRFAVYSNNTVCASFLDGVLLYMIWNFANFDKNEEGPDCTTPCTTPSSVRQEQFTWFSLRFPNGSTKLVEMEDPGEYASYIRTTMAWCRWLDEKSLGEMVTPVSTETDLVKGFGTVARELEKIQRFNFLLERGSTQSHRNDIKLPSRTNNADDGQDGTEINIQSILEKTSKAIQDIDLLLSSRK